MKEDILDKLRNISLLAMDFDGVHTNGFVYVDQYGVESVRCSRRDSLGLGYLRNLGIKLAVISKERNPVVLTRCKKLDVECYQGVEDSLGKRDILEALVQRENVPISQVAFIGDDVNDIETIQYAGIGITVADGHNDIKKVADLILTRKGGDHALRELCDLIIETRGGSFHINK
jgi:YrbI family 3-deoxy-D-manno-octulosonate 8-phosphate phosphatase